MHPRNDWGLPCLVELRLAALPDSSSLDVTVGVNRAFPGCRHPVRAPPRCRKRFEHPVSLVLPDPQFNWIHWLAPGAVQRVHRDQDVCIAALRASRATPCRVCVFGHRRQVPVPVRSIQLVKWRPVSLKESFLRGVIRTDPTLARPLTRANRVEATIAAVHKWNSNCRRPGRRHEASARRRGAGPVGRRGPWPSHV